MSAAASSDRASVSMPAMCAWKRSVRLTLCRRSFASKLKPPVVNPPAARISWSEIGIEERLVTLASAPQHVVRSVEAVGYLEHRLDLRGRVREHLGIGIRRGARRVARVTEQVRRAPEKPRSGALHVLFDPIHA